MMIDGPDFQGGFLFPKGSFHPPQAFIGLGHLDRRQVGVGSQHELAIQSGIPLHSVFIDGGAPLGHLEKAGIAPVADDGLWALFFYGAPEFVYDSLPEIRDSAEALGLSPWVRLRLIELPMASREILAGIKTSAVINVGTATLGALIGAGGYGQPILTGIRLDDLGLILSGAMLAALLALLVQGGFDLAELVVVPKGLRLKPGE
jgi:hypothetical protein